MFKKVLSTLLAASMTLAIPAAFAATGFTDLDANTSANPSLVSAASELRGLGILKGDDKGNLNASDNVTRVDALTMVVRALGYGNVAIKATSFADMTNAQDYQKQTAALAKNLGLTTGYVKDGKSVFGPSDNVTYAQLVAFAVRSLGYADKDLTGSWPYNFITKATELGLLDNVSATIDPNAAANRGDVAVVVDNMLNTPTKDQQAKFDTTSVYSDKVTTPKHLLEKVLSKLDVTTKTDAQVVTASEVSGRVAAGTFQVKDDNNVYKLSTDQLKVAGNNNLIGKLVSFYASKKANTDGTYDVISVTNVKGTAISLNLGANSVLDQVAPTAITTDASTTLVKIDTDRNQQDPTKHSIVYFNSAAKVYLNGKVLSNGADGKFNIKAVNDLLTATNAYSGDAVAKVTLVENDDKTSDGYDAVAFTISKAPVFAPATPTSTDVLSAANILGLNFKNAAGTAADVYVTGDATKLTDIKPLDVLYVYSNEDNSSIVLDVVRKTVTGQVTTKTGNDTDGYKLTIAGTEYGTDKEAGPAGINVGDQGTFYVDKNGKVIRAVVNTPFGYTNTSSLGNYGYVSAYNSNAGSLSFGAATNGQVQIKGFDGNTTTYNLQGVNATAFSTTDSTSLLGKVVYFTKDPNNSSIITSITLAVSAPSTVNNVITYPNVPANFNAFGVTPNTVVADVSDSKKNENRGFTLRKSSDIDWTKVTQNNVEAVVPSGSNVLGLGGYGAVILKDAANLDPVTGNVTSGLLASSLVKQAAGSYMFVAGQARTGLVTVNNATVAANVYNVFVNGAAQTINVPINDNLNNLVTGNLYYGLNVDANTNVTKAANPSVSPLTANYTGAYKGTTGAQIGVDIPGLGTGLYTLDANVKVYDVNNKACTSVYAIPVSTPTSSAVNVKIFLNPTNNNVIAIIYNY